MKIGEQIKTRREELKMTIKELADRVGVTPQSIRNWERGQRQQPRPENYKALQRALSFRLDLSEGGQPIESQGGGVMMAQGDVDLLLVIARLPPQAKRLFDELARMHLEAVEAARATSKH